MFTVRGLSAPPGSVTPPYRLDAALAVSDVAFLACQDRDAAAVNTPVELAGLVVQLVALPGAVRVGLDVVGAFRRQLHQG